MQLLDRARRCIRALVALAEGRPTAPASEVIQAAHELLAELRAATEEGDHG